MMNILLFVVMIITLMGAATYGLVGAMRNLQTGIEGMLVQDRLEEAAQAVAANIVSITTSTSQIYYVPAPDNLSPPAVPTWVTPNAQTTRGVKFLYCPFTNNTRSTGSFPNTITTPSSSYGVTVAPVLSHYVNDISYKYVYISGPRPTNQPYALAILVAPGPGQSALLPGQDCLNVSATGTLPGATVRVITEQEVQSRAQVIASYGNEFYAAAAASGDGKGTSVNNSATFSTVMDYVNKFRPQRVTVNLHPHMTSGFIPSTFSAGTTDMDQTTVTTRQFTAVRNHSIYYNSYFLSGSSGGAYITTSASGTFSPVVLGNVGFNRINFPAVSGQLLRPVADSFGNVIMFNSANLYAAAENLGRVVNVSANTIPAPASSPTGGEMYYTQNGGMLIMRNGLDLFGSSSSPITTNYIIYNDFGGSTAATNLGYFEFFWVTGSVPPVFVSGGGSLTGTLFTDTSTSYPYLLENDLGSRSYTSLTSDGIPGVYNQGGFFSGSIVMDGNSPSYTALAGPGSNFNLTTSGVRPSVATIHSNSANGQYGMAAFSGGGSLLGSNSGSTQCLSDMAAYNFGSDSNNVAGASLVPRGNIGMEAAIITNHSTGGCN